MARDIFERRRRQVITGLGMAGLGLMAPRWARPAAAATDAKSRPFEGETLNVFVYAGAWENAFRDVFVPVFEAETGASVVTIPGWWDSIAKLQASPPGRPAFDLVLTDATQGYPAIRQGMFQTIDLGAIPNTENVAKSTLDNWVYKENYGVPFPDSAMTLAWNNDLVDFKPQTWGDLMREDLSGQIGLYDSFYMSLFTFAAMKVASEGRAGTAKHEIETNLDGVMAFAKDQRGRVGYWWPTSSDMALNLAQENTAIGNMHSTDIVSALESRKSLGAIAPDLDRAYLQLMWLVPDGTRQKTLAETAINTMLTPKIQEGFARAGRMTSYLPVAKKVAAESPYYEQFYPVTEAGLSELAYYPYETYAEHWDDIAREWDRDVLR